MTEGEQGICTWRLGLYGSTLKEYNSKIQVSPSPTASAGPSKAQGEAQPRPQLAHAKQDTRGAEVARANFGLGAAHGP